MLNRRPLSVVIVVLLALVSAVAVASPVSAAEASAAPAVHIGTPFFKQTSPGGGLVTVTMAVQVRTTATVSQVRIYLHSTGNHTTKTLYADLEGGGAGTGVWVGTGHFTGDRDSAWRADRVRVYGTGGHLLRDKKYTGDGTEVLAMRVIDQDDTWVSTHRAVGATTQRHWNTHFLTWLDEETGGRNVTFTATFRRTSGSTFTRHKTVATDENGGVSVVFGPYKAKKMSRLTLTGPAVDGQTLHWGF